MTTIFNREALALLRAGLWLHIRSERHVESVRHCLAENDPWGAIPYVIYSELYDLLRRVVSLIVIPLGARLRIQRERR